MKLITEAPMFLEGTYEDELNESSGITERNFYLKGICSTPDAKNRNGRVYSKSIWEREVSTYQNEIKNKTVNSLGEWQHPPRSTVDPMKAVIRITELKFKEDGNVWVKAKILNDNTEITNRLKGLIKEGIKIGISTRGVGKVSATGVVESYKLITADLVDLPSDYNAMLDGVVEGVEFINGIAQDKEYQLDENGCIGEVCSMDSAISESTEKCPIQEKINEAINSLREEMVDGLDEYLSESFGNVEKKREELIENISDFLNPKEEIVENIDRNSDVDLATKILSALNESKEEEEKEVGEGTCSECGKELTEDDEDDEICNSCLDEDEEVKEAKAEIKNLIASDKLTENDVEDMRIFSKLCNPESLEEDLVQAFGHKIDEDIISSIHKEFLSL